MTEGILSPLLQAIGMLAYIALVVIFGPMFLIGSLNLLFDLSIPQNSETWLAGLVIIWLFS